MCVGHGGRYVRGLAFNPDGSRIVSVGDDKQIVTWDAESDSIVEPLQTVASKQIVTGDVDLPDKMQPERVGSFFASWLWPAEPTTGGTSFEHVAFAYPERTLPGLGFLPGGPFGVLLVFLIASMLFGVLILKPLGIQI